MDDRLTRRSMARLLTSLTGALLAGAAGPLGTPAARPVLTVAGKIKVFNDGDLARLDRPMLEALGMSSIVTQTPWYEQPVRFEGVPMAKLMEELGAFGTTVQAVALNEYTTELPVEDFSRFGTLLAFKRDGNYMPVSDNGPFFIVYPYDSNPDLRAQRYYGRSAWQVTRLIVK